MIGDAFTPFVTTNEDTPITLSAGTSVLANDTDIDGDTLSITSAGPATSGTVTHTATNVTYSPTLNTFGDDSFSYTVCDNGVPSLCNSAMVYLTVLPIDDTPHPANDTYATPFSQFGGPYPLDVLANDVDNPLFETDPLHIESLVAPTPRNPVSIQPSPNVLIYDPDPTGTAIPFHSPTIRDVFNYRVCDTNTQGATPQSACATAQVSLLINDAPIANDDPGTGPTPTPDPIYYTVDEDTTLSVADDHGVLVNDYDPNVPTPDPITAVLLAGPSHVSGVGGSFSLDANGGFTYHATLNYNGTDTFTYRAYDGGLYSSSSGATVTVHIIPVNDAPVAVADPSYVVTQGGSLNVAAAGVLANDTDVDFDPLTAVLNSGPTHIVNPSDFTLNSDGSFDYTPDPAFAGNDTFTYFANDGTVDSALPATVTIKVNGPPVAIDDTYNVNEDTLLSVPLPGVKSNDTDPNGDPLTAILDTPPSTFLPGSWSFNNGAFTYRGAANWSGSDSFTYHVIDTGGLVSNTATVTINVFTQDDPPAAVGESYSTSEDTPLNVDLLR